MKMVQPSFLLSNAALFGFLAITLSVVSGTERQDEILTNMDMMRSQDMGMMTREDRR